MEVLQAGYGTILALPHSQQDVEAGHCPAAALISVTGTGASTVRTEDGDYPGGVLSLCFDDISLDHWVDVRGRAWTGPTPEQVERALGWARGIDYSRDATLAIHCLRGRSRSAALAILVNADALGPGGEVQAVHRVLSRQARQGAPPERESMRMLAPNPAILRMGEAILGTGGAIETAVTQALPRYRSWCAFWTAQGMKPSRDGHALTPPGPQRSGG